jgi:hypothetical protein
VRLLSRGWGWGDRGWREAVGLGCWHNSLKTSPLVATAKVV